MTHQQHAVAVALQRRALHAQVTFLAFFLTVALAMHSTIVTAQSIDDRSLDNAGDSGVLGEPQLIEADVGDDTEITEISLFYRFSGEQDFRAIPMTETSRGGLYEASVATDGVNADQMQFYIAAEAADGGTLLKGSAFAPLTRILNRSVTGDTAAEAPINTSRTTEPMPVTGSNRSRYIYIALGVLAAGALVAATSGGGDGGSTEACDADGCDLTIELPNP